MKGLRFSIWNLGLDIYRNCGLIFTGLLFPEMEGIILFGTQRNN